ncbi:GEVED domain-containing protein [Dyadobacter luticola]|uniref:T9SS type A sorting domain-containing protein n=1 Tax=Dyadobacter luticola TaxID=1979387 RepID=A0A5R9KM34_9BACT|nr:GEVED domain-containing protein [Dyadobacter luticola]TLU97291.1 T9SS type A sorting domain-containing protein [Dyadobacter luticola]
MKTLYFNYLVWISKRLILLLTFTSMISPSYAQQQAHGGTPNTNARVNATQGTIVISKKAVSEISPGADFSFTNNLPVSQNIILNDDPSFISMQDVGMGEDNTIWAIAAPESGLNGNIYYRRPATTEWVQAPGMGVRLDVTRIGNSVLVNEAGHLFQWTGSDFRTLNDRIDAVDVGVSAGTPIGLFVLLRNFGCHILARYTGTSELTTFPNICGTRLDVSPDGSIYVLSEQAGQIYRVEIAGTTATVTQTFAAQGFRDVTVAADGRVWAVDRDYCYYLENGAFVKDLNSSGAGEGTHLAGLSAGSDGDTPILTLNASDDAPTSARGQIVQRREDGSWMNSHKVGQSGRGNSIIVNVEPGTYNITENPGNWKLTGINAVGGSVVKNLQTNSASVSVLAGQTVHIEFVNTGYDYGDAPDSYGTLSASSGAVHQVNPALTLGSTIDIDANGVPGTAAAGDNTTGQNDEDGVSSFPTISPTGSKTFTNYTVKVSARNTTGSTANLCGWIDWNNNGTFESGEGVCTTLPTSGTEATLVWPSSTLSGPTGTSGTYARFRLTTNFLTTGGVTGLATDGEVEDYFIPFSGPLPVTLMTFEGSLKESHVALEWATAEEANADRFEIQHSTNGKNWNLIGTVLAKGESSVRENYEFQHAAIVNGQNFYRLKMIDRDETFAFSKIVRIVFDKTSAFMVYPNPATHLIRISNNELVKQVTLHSASGVKVFELKDHFHEGIDVSELSQGIYMITISHLNGTVSTQKVLIARE